MKTFSYHEPKNIPEVLSLLRRHGKKAALLAGGTDLLVEMKEGVRSPSHLISLQGIDSLRKIEVDTQGGVKIGPMATVQAVSTHPVLKNSLLAQGAAAMASWQVRNRATLGGNICRASPSGDTLPALLCLNAVLHLERPEGSRTVGAEGFFRGPGQTAAAEGEMLTGIYIPPWPPGSRGVYKKFAVRKKMDLAVVGVAVLAVPDGSRDLIREIRIGLGAVAPTPIRARQAENLLAGSGFGKELIAEGGRLAAEEAKPQSDVRAGAWYRLEIVRHVTEAAIHEVIRRPYIF
jgi:carbon-monoxide dehydrogenase medium subunit